MRPKLKMTFATTRRIDHWRIRVFAGGSADYCRFREVLCSKSNQMPHFMATWRSLPKWSILVLLLLGLGGALCILMMMRWWAQPTAESLSFTDAEYVLRWTDGVEQASGTDSVRFELK